jgi:hypothetical protein
LTFRADPLIAYLTSIAAKNAFDSAIIALVAAGFIAMNVAAANSAFDHFEP